MTSTSSTSNLTKRIALHAIINQHQRRLACRILSCKCADALPPLAQATPPVTVLGIYTVLGSWLALEPRQ